MGTNPGIILRNRLQKAGCPEACIRTFYTNRANISIVDSRHLAVERDELEEMAMPGIPVVYQKVTIRELLHLENPYATLLRDHADISRGAFAPTDIEDHFPIRTGDTAELRFSFRGQSYRFQFRINGDWIDNDFFSVPNRILEEEAIPGHFHTLYSEGQEALRIFLTPAQYDYLRAQRLAIFPDMRE